MKYIIKAAIITIFSSFIFLYSHYVEASNNELLTLVRNTVSTNCTLTTLNNKELVIEESKITIYLKFDNSQMRGSWTSDVAVQYLFDACVGALTKAVFSDQRFYKFNTIHFDVWPRPHDWLNDLGHEVFKFEFWLKRKDWNEYNAEGPPYLEKKAKLYRSMDVHIDNKVLKYNPDRAVDIQ